MSQEFLDKNVSYNGLFPSVPRYHTIAKTKTIASLKKSGLISDDVILEQVLFDCFKEWPDNKKFKTPFSDVDSTLCMS